MLGGLASVVFAPQAARASGGLDIPGPEIAHTMRVSLGAAAGPAPVRVDPYTFAYAGRTYRGAFAVEQIPDGSEVVVNTLPLDAYLYGVVSREVSPAWPRAALQAQAIAARTYALLRRRPKLPYDVVATVSDQYYGGVATEAVPARDAVDSTSGQFVLWNGAAAPLQYGSCCGGYTADASVPHRVAAPVAVDLRAIGESPSPQETPVAVAPSPEGSGSALPVFPYLRGRPDPHCALAPDFRWHRELVIGDPGRLVGHDLAAALGGLRDVTPRAFDASGRPATIRFTGTKSILDFDAVDVRRRFGVAQLRSTRLLRCEAVRDDRGAVVGLSVDGAGFGHGAGMCQWGARAMAADGASASDILAFYYPGTTLGTV